MLIISRAQSPTQLASMRDLLAEYRDLIATLADSSGVCPWFDKMDEELVQLPWEYAPPAGQLLLARQESDVAGCVALRPLGPDRCEMRRLYVRPPYRSAGVGRGLVNHLIADARQLGYSEMLLTTLPAMTTALTLYRSLGFRKTEPYVDQPHASVIYLALRLK